MNQRKDSYRAALRRGQDIAAPRPAKVTTLDSRYVRVTIEVDPDLRRDLTRWAGTPVSALVLTGTALLRTVARVAGSADAEA
ncbi:hypothetical protein NGB36_00170 [Streptomyces sp. RB6PN25]|uniref:Uncharacterized protein n=1 Tax=Streptomyces humicola TaxID=2953240 RepID=A0ABT1PN25_9ACTN|nr:hypothetical protein [Streptomyces humicola]MCQ4079077.1 hypothetical protein [Streptomyces humicola]